MTELANLSIVIDVLDRFSDDLTELLSDLETVDAAAEKLDPIEIGVNVHDGELDALMGKMATMGALDAGMGRGGGMAVDVSTEGGGGGRSMDIQTAQLSRLIRDVNLLPQNLTENLGDLSTKARQSADGLSKSVMANEGFIAALKGGQLRMSDLHNAMARLIPLLFVLIGAIPALYGAFIGLAGAAAAAAVALGSLTAFAAMGLAEQRGGGDMMAGFQEIINQIQSDFMDAFAPLMNRLEPLFEDALDGLDKLFQAIANEGDALVRLQQVAREFGGWVLETLPSFLADLANFVNAVSDALGAIAGQIDFNIFKALAGFLADVLPQLMIFIDQVINLIPHIVRMSEGFVSVASAVLALFNLVLDVVTAFGLFDEQLGVLIGTLLAVYGLTLIYNSALFTLAGAALVNAGRAMLSFAATLFTGSSALSVAIQKTIMFAYANKLLAGALALGGIAALAMLFSAIAGGAAKATTEIDKATKSLRQFQRQQNSMTTGRNPYANPKIERGSERATGAGGDFNQVNVTVQGSADTEEVRNQTQNGLYRLERTRRGK